MLAFSKRPNRVKVSFPSPEDGNRPSFRNVLFSSYLEFRTIDIVHKRSHSEPFVHRQDRLESTASVMLTYLRNNLRIDQCSWQNYKYERGKFL
jgi:hypothetical protein